MESKELGIYIHIPFCKRKCYYCDFISYSGKDDSFIKTYIQKVLQEMQQYNFENYNITTIYIGGGTPSYIQAKYILELLKSLKSKLQKNETNFEKIEITLEINPATITQEKLKQYKKAGINRISIGLQTTNDKLLRQIGRIHTYQDFLEAYQLVQKVGFQNINIDLMIGLPNQSIQDVKQSLEKIQHLKPDHISIYSLIVEEGTKLEKLISSGQLCLPNEELERQMYWYVKNTLELNGYQHYEISNFAKKGKESKHNLNCWKQKEYIGLGAAAHSYLKDIRYSNASFTPTGDWDFTNKKIEEKQTIEDKKKEYMLLGLRKLEGVSIQKFKEKYGENPIFLYRKQIDKLVKEKLLIVEGNWIHLTNQGIDLANLVWEEFV